MPDFINVMLRDHRGIVFAINILDSIKERLLDESLVTGFLKECALRLPDGPGIAFLNVMAAMKDAAQASYFNAATNQYMLAGKKQSDLRAELTSTVMRSSTLHKHVLSDQGRMKIPVSPPSSPLGIGHYRMLMQRLHREVSWLNPTGTLGLNNGRQLILLWVTHAGSLDSRGNKDKISVRDWLGLSHFGPREHLVSVSIDSSKALDGSFKNSRPTFADGGNERFRVGRDSGRADDCWGMTVDLYSLDKNIHDPKAAIDGGLEQVCEPLPLVGDISLSFKYTEKVERTHDATDEKFSELLLKKSGRSLDHVRDELLRLLVAT